MKTESNPPGKVQTAIHKNSIDQNTIIHYAIKVLENCRNAALLRHRFLAVAFNRLNISPAVESPIIFGTDGKSLLLRPLPLLRRYMQDPASVETGYLHAIIHCLYLHPFLARGRDKALWNLSSDIFVREIMRKLGNCEEENSRRERALQELLDDSGRVVSAQGIYRTLERQLHEGRLNGWQVLELASLFREDDHDLWYAAKKEGQGQSGGKSRDKKAGIRERQAGQPQISEEDEESGEGDAEAEALSRKWQEIARGVEVALRTEASKHGSSMGQDPGSFLQTLAAVTRENYSYETFLKKFAVFEERMRTSPDEFDYIYYTYGLSLYGDVPLVEPLEYQEVKTIREFAIAIDTSGSCDDELVRKFLTKTYNILCEGEVFAKTINVHVIQCDAAVQEDAVLRNRRDILRFTEQLEIRGRGGTDFRPVFTYIEELQEKGELLHLAGLLYFTDGYGIFPALPPPYKTAFVFAEQDQDVQVPPWAMKVYVEKEAL